MHYRPTLISARLIKRYKRFLADIELKDGQQITVHCANTGAMTGCTPANANIWISDSQNPKRKLRYSWEWVEVEDKHKVCINTQRANQLVSEALSNKVFSEFTNIQNILSEPKVEDGRLDFLIQQPNQADTYLEVKNLTLLKNKVQGIGSFPDALTQRGRKHLLRLLALKEQGFNAAMLFCVAHEGIQQIQADYNIDPDYAKTLELVHKKGVSVMAYKVKFSDNQMWLDQPVPFNL